MVDRVGAPYRVFLYQPSIRFSLITNSKVLSLQQQAIPFPREVYAQQATYSVSRPSNFGGSSWDKPY